jgi:hypothetical protein
VFLDVCSHLLQFPHIKIEWMLVLLSVTQGVGKDTALLPLREGVGPANWKAAQLTDLLGTNNAHVSECQVLYLMELPGGRQRDAIELLKARIASVAGERIVNPKYVAPYTVQDRTSHISTTNHFDALDLTGDDRRTAVLRTQEKRLPPDLARRVYALFDIHGTKRGLHLVAEYLRQRQISALFDPKRCPAPSEAKEEMRTISLEGTPAGVLFERLTVEDVPESMADRTVLWHREVQAAMEAGKGHARYAGRRGQLQLAMELAGWRRHPRAPEDGRLRLVAPRVDGVQRQVAVSVWIRAADADMRALEGRQVVDRLHLELREHGRHGDAAELGKLLAKLGGGDAGDDGDVEASVSLEERRAARRKKKPEGES